MPTKTSQSESERSFDAVAEKPPLEKVVAEATGPEHRRTHGVGSDGNRRCRRSAIRPTGEEESVLREEPPTTAKES